MIETRRLLLEEAESLMRTRGYAAFSYADLSERVGIRKASIHHHFRTKEELGAALIDGYPVKFRAALAEIRAEEPSALPRLHRYGAFFTDSIRDGMMPLCGALSAETFALPVSMRQRVREFFELHLDWLQSVMRDGVVEGTLRADLDEKRSAGMLLSVLEGASLVAWALRDFSVIDPAFEQAIESLKA
jgi:TetR/AcrR family transcriptional regulator, transcriptional repressor for nem operon